MGYAPPPPERIAYASPPWWPAATRAMMAADLEESGGRIGNDRDGREGEAMRSSAWAGGAATAGMLAVAIVLWGLPASPALAQSPRIGGGPIEIGPLDHNIEIDALHRRAVARARRLGLPPARPRALPNPILRYPLRLRPNAKGLRGDAISNFVDLDATRRLKEFTCGTRTYDGHRGVDYFLFPYWWLMMDKREMEIIAAAPGTIIDKDDGHFDRQCTTGSNRNANYVVIRQDDGVYAYYWHMKRGSVTGRPIGSRVAAGEYLGLVGSSGNSTGPHLHFEFRTTAGATVDPYAGRCGDKKTSWRHQHEDAHTAILRVATHKRQPTPYPSSCGENSPAGYADRFKPGSTVWAAVYLRDQRPNTPLQLTILRPDGTTFFSWTYDPPSSVFPTAYYYYGFDLPTTNARGQWTVRAMLAGQTTEHTFIVGPRPNGTSLRTRVRPSTASLTRATAAKFRVIVRNKGAAKAVGCTLAPDVPLAAKWKFRRKGRKAWDSAAFDIAPGGRKVLILSIRPKRGYKARSLPVPIRVFCINANAPKAKEGVNIVTLTF